MDLVNSNAAACTWRSIHGVGTRVACAGAAFQVAFEKRGAVLVSVLRLKLAGRGGGIWCVQGWAAGGGLCLVFVQVRGMSIALVGKACEGLCGGDGVFDCGMVEWLFELCT